MAGVDVTLNPLGAGCTHVLLKERATGNVLEVVQESDFFADVTEEESSLLSQVKQLLSETNAKTTAQAKSDIEAADFDLSGGGGV